MADARWESPDDDRRRNAMGRLDGKVAFITGAARGQGRSHAVRLAQEGCEIIGLDLCGQIDSVAYPMATPDDLADTVRLVEEHDHRMVAEQADVRDLDRLGAVLQKGLKEFGRLDIVVANAGIAPIVGEQRLQVQAWNDAIDVMLTGVYHTLHATVPVLIEGGRGGSIVITSSTAGLKGFFLGEITAGAMGYTAAKHGVVGLMRAYANALALHNIRVNSVHPTGVDTPMVVNEPVGQYVGEHPEAADAFQNAMPVPLVEVHDVSNAIVWLCSDEARYVTGVTLPVDAGRCNR
jgi:SDR family mycofactocin-dependent oxidoreductase